MNLKDLFDALNAGELRLNYIGDDVNGAADFKSRQKLLALTRRVLTELHTRFDLRIKEAVISVGVEDTYTLDIVNYPALLKIERVLVEDEGEYVPQPLNQKQNNRSYQATDYRTIVLPKKLDTRPTSIIVEYREDHPDLTIDVLYAEPQDIVLEIPMPFLEPMALYIAGKIHAGNGAADGVDLATALLTQYEIACQKLEAFNMDNDQLEWRDVIYEDGWV